MAANFQHLLWALVYLVCCGSASGELGREIETEYDGARLALVRQLAVEDGLTGLQANPITWPGNGAAGIGGLQLTSDYDALNRLQALHEGSRTTGYAYDLVGNLTKKTLPNGVTSVSVYDGTGRRILQEDGAGGALSRTRSLSDPGGNLRLSVEETATLAPRTLHLRYDGADRLTGEVENATENAVTHTTQYQYDAASNRTQKTADGLTTTYSYNHGNQLTGWSRPGASASATYTYDANGNRATCVSGGITRRYFYDEENRLSSLNTNPGQPANPAYTGSYRYDYRGRRVSRTEANSGQTNVVFSGGTSVQEWNSGGALTREEVRGSDWGGGVGGILYRHYYGDTTYAHYDQRGDVTAWSNSAGAVTWQASYEAGGKRTAEYGYTQERQKANTKEEDPTGLLNEGLRYRDLETGTFITRDPAGFVDGPNLYAYVRQNPWTKFDPDGLQEFGFGNPLRKLSEASDQLKRAVKQGLIGEGQMGSWSGAPPTKMEEVNKKIVEPILNEILQPVDTVANGFDSARKITEGKKVTLKDIAKIALVGVMIGELLEGGDSGEKTTRYRGGQHGDLNTTGDSLDSHHMPAKQASPLPIDEGPAIQMDPDDHRKTASYGGGPGTPQQAYRDQQKALIEKGKFNEAFEMDAKDIQSKFGSKYDKAIEEARTALPTVEIKKKK